MAEAKSESSGFESVKTMSSKSAASKPEQNKDSIILAIRLRGEVGVKKGIEDTMQMLGLKRRYSGILLERNENTAGMIRKIESFIAWGEASAETVAMLKTRLVGRTVKSGFGLKPPVGGLKAIKLNWPKGDLGYRGSAINELVKRMI